MNTIYRTEKYSGNKDDQGCQGTTKQIKNLHYAEEKTEGEYNIANKT